MASGESAPNEPLDERLAELRDSALMQGENVVAQEAGDAGQAIVLTDSRVILLKAGITATGELNGQKVGAYALSDVTAVNVRKGPVGAVIQVVSGSNEPANQGGPPDNIIVFTGPQKVKRCEAIAVQMEVAIGKPLERVEAKRGTRSHEPVQARSPEAEGAVSRDETTAEEQAPNAEPAEHSSVVDQRIDEELEEEEEERIEVRPNPNLPKPVRARSSGPGRVLALIGVLAALVLVGIAVTAPLREAQKPLPKITMPDASKDPALIKEELSSISDYRKKAAQAVAEGETIAARIEAGLRSRNRSALSSAVSGDATDKLCSEFDKVEAPSGLAAAKESISNGLFGLRTIAASISGGLQSEGDLDAPSRLTRIADARALLRSGLKAVDARTAALKSRLAKP